MKKDPNGHEEELSLDGVNGFVMFVRDEGKEITISGWTDHWRFNEKQRILLHNKDGSTTRYKIKSINRPGDPPDMYFMTCTFLPRS